MSASTGVGILLSAPASASTVYFVDKTSPSCSVTGPGTSAHPFCTIAGAASVALAGDTVLVRAGTYPGTSVNPKNSGVTFTALPGVKISGGKGGFSLSGKSNTVISGFVITGGSTYGIWVSGGSNVTISGNTVSFAGIPVTSPAGGIYLTNVNGGKVSGNVIHDNSANGITLVGTTTGVTVKGNSSYHNAYQNKRGASGIQVAAPGNSIIDNWAYSNEESGIALSSGANNTLIAGNVVYDNGNHGIDNSNVTGGRVMGNTVYYNCVVGLNVEGTSGNYDVQNNIAMDNATGAIINPTPIAINPSTGLPYYTNTCNRRDGNIGIFDSAPATTKANYNLVYQSNGTSAEYVWGKVTYNTQQAIHDGTGQEAEGIFANPKFVNTAAWNLQLTEGSPAIDSANSGASGEQSADILGNPRVDDPATPNTGGGPFTYWDRGAYEFQPTGGPTGPTAALSVAPSSGVAPLMVTADASASTAGSAPISSYSFNFGDGTTVGPQPGATASHTYASPGTYPVTVTVIDGNNLTSQATKTVTVSPALVPPTAALTVTPSAGSAPLAVTADASASKAGSAPISSYSFNFGDGTTVGPQPGATAGHTYTSAGSYTVTVTVTDGNNLTSQATKTVTVSPQSTTTAKYINQTATNYSTISHTSGYVTVWRTGGVAAGDMIIATVELTGTSAGAVHGTDTAGDTLAVASDISDGSGNRLVILYGVATTGLPVGAKITITFPTAATYRIIADEVSGATTLDQQSAAGGTGSAFSSGATGTTSRSGEFVVAATAAFGGTSIIWGSGWTNIGAYTTGTNGLGRAYQIPAATGTFTGSGTTTGTSWLTAVATFR